MEPLETQLASPLEQFLRDFVEQNGGVWDELEPQLYDVLLPAEVLAGWDPGRQDVVRVTFDPDALPEHPDSQLATFGTPLIDRLLTAAADRGRIASIYRNGLHFLPHGLPQRVARSITLPEGWQLEIERQRALFVPAAVFWFQATFVSDEKEYQLLPVAFDLHYARQVRHLDQLLAAEHLGDRPDVFLPDAKHATPAEVFPLARREVVRSLTPLVNARARELNERTERQAARMHQYYADMLTELEEQQQRAMQRGMDLDKYQARRQALEREQRLRVAELRQRSSLRVQLRLAALLVVRQPKVRLMTRAVGDRGSHVELELLWDPLVESLEAIPCPACLRPTFTLQATRQRSLACPQCG